MLYIPCFEKKKMEPFLIKNLIEKQRKLPLYHATKNRFHFLAMVTTVICVALNHFSIKILNYFFQTRYVKHYLIFLKTFKCF